LNNSRKKKWEKKVVEKQIMLNSFKTLREKLLKQYSEPHFDSESGLSKEMLREKLSGYAAANRDLPHILLKANLFKLIVENGRLDVDPDDPFADHLDGRDLLLPYQQIWARENPIPDIAANQRDRDSGLGEAKLDLSHTSPDWSSILELGVTGLRDRALAAGDSDFYRAVAIVYDSFRNFILRLADQARKAGNDIVTDNLEFLADKAPETLYQALQLSYLYNQLQEMEGELVRSQGIFDQLFWPFYQHDNKQGIATDRQVKDLLHFFYLKCLAQNISYGKNLNFGSSDEKERDLSNHFTLLALQAWREVRTCNPKICLRINPHTPASIKKLAVSCVLEGLTGIVFSNDQVARKMLSEGGKPPEDIRDYLLIGCYEPSIMGREMCCSMACTFNFAKVVELVFAQARLPESYAEFEKSYLDLLEKSLKRLMAAAREFEKTWKTVNPSPLLSGSMRCCLVSGRDVSDGGTQYNNSGIMCAGLPDAADSLDAVREMVFNRQIVTLEELKQHLQNDWQDAPLLQAKILNTLPKWGNNNPELDSIAKRISAFTANLINHSANTRGGHFQTGIWSIYFNVNFGAKTGALPNGRHKGKRLAQNLSSSIGMDRNGVTSLINSSARLNHAQFLDGSILDIMLHPSAVAGDRGRGVIPELIRTYFEQGGLAIQFNIFNAESLKQAQQEPEKFTNLQVRVCGWNIRFIDLDRDSQDAFIAQAEALV